jgi:hypothetical protein
LTRIFLSLAVVATLALAANLLLGLATGDLQSAVKEEFAARQSLGKLSRDRSVPVADVTAARERLTTVQRTHAPLRQAFSAHFWLGIMAALLTLLVNSIAITYFVGTSRWCKEVVDAYRLDQAYDQRGQRIKRRSFAWSVVGALTVIVLVGVGAASDPTAANFENSQLVVPYHRWLALAGVPFILWAFWQQWQRISENFRLIEEVMGEVRRVKEEQQAAVAQ